MISTFWFLIKVTVALGFFMWLAAFDEPAVLTFGPYTITTHIGILLILAVITLYLSLLFIRWVRAILSVPKAIAVRQEKMQIQQSFQSLSYGLSAIAAGDTETADDHVRKLRKYLKDDFGLSSLIAALSARLKGDEAGAEKQFKAMLNHNETAFLGLKGLLQTALTKKDYRYARVLARQVYDRFGAQSWILNTLYTLELHHKDLAAAQKILKQQYKKNFINKQNYNHARAVMALYIGDAKTAYKLDKNPLPIALAWARMLQDRGKRRACLKVIKDIWVDTPHPEALAIWMTLAPKKAQNDATLLLAWAEDLYRLNPNHPDSGLYVGEWTVRHSLTDRAKQFLQYPIEANPTIRAYQLMNICEPLSGWLDLLPSAKADKAWISGQTGKIFESWQGYDDANAFDQIIWASPDDVRRLDRETSISGLTLDFFSSPIKTAA